MCRHFRGPWTTSRSSRCLTDEQRPESWGADARDLADILYINSCGDMRLSLPFYTIEEMISEWAFNRFMRLYEDFRFRRGDNTLLVHILKSVVAWLWRRNLRIYTPLRLLDTQNRKGARHDGRQDGKEKVLPHERKNLC